MKLPKSTRRYCPYCKKHVEHRIKEVSSGAKRGSLKRGSIQRARRRGLGRGLGNRGKWGSKPAVSKFKRKTKATTKKVVLYTCQECKKSHNQRKSKRTSKLQIEDKEKSKKEKIKQENLNQKQVNKKKKIKK